MLFSGAGSFLWVCMLPVCVCTALHTRRAQGLAGGCSISLAHSLDVRSPAELAVGLRASLCLFLPLSCTALELWVLWELYPDLYMGAGDSNPCPKLVWQVLLPTEPSPPSPLSLETGSLTDLTRVAGQFSCLCLPGAGAWLFTWALGIEHGSSG